MSQKQTEIIWQKSKLKLFLIVAMTVTVRNVAAFVTTGIFGFVICILCVLLLYKIHNNHELSRLMRILTIIYAVNAIIESGLTLTQELLTLFFSTANEYVWVFWTFHVGLSFFLLGLIFSARLFHTFKHSSYSYSKKFYVLTMIWFLFLSLIGFVTLVGRLTTSLVNQETFAIMSISYFVLVPLSLTFLVGLFIYSLKKVKQKTYVLYTIINVWFVSLIHIYIF